MKRKLLTTTAAAVALAVAGCGSEDTSSADVQGNGVDRAFVAEMIPHHQSAVAMAEIARRRGSSPFVKKLADDIVRTQEQEISTMRAEDGQLKAAEVRKGSLGVAASMMGMGAETASLKTAKPFDRAFIAMMLPHHQGAVTMARAEIAKGEDPELKQLARDIIRAQEREIRAMRAAREKA